jgi:hypothetical protein
VTACAGIGPGTVPHDRIDYGSAIGDSWKEQTLLNIIKLRYVAMPIVLEFMGSQQPRGVIPSR